MPLNIGSVVANAMALERLDFAAAIERAIHLYASIGSFKDIGHKLHDRYAHVATHAEVSIPIAAPADRQTLAALIQGLKSGYGTTRSGAD